MGTLGQQVSGMEQMDKLVGLCKRRGFVFANSEVYSGLAGFWDYGPLGVELKKNIERFWWDFMVRRRDNVSGLDSSCIGPEAVWKASGHVDAFNDALIDDKNSKERFRIDQLAYKNEEDAETAERFALKCLSVLPNAGKVVDSRRYSSNNPNIEMSGALKHLISWRLTLEGIKTISKGKGYEEFRPDALNAITDTLKIDHLIDTTDYQLVESLFWDGLKDQIGYYPNNPTTGKPSRFTVPRQFNLMFKQAIGATGEAGQVGYLRAETCQPIFVDFDSVRVTGRHKVPFGIGQVGKAFRNEINPRNFLFRAREFEQMELEFFVRPDELVEKMKAAGIEAKPTLGDQPNSLASTMDWYDYWFNERKCYYKELGIPDDMLRIRQHPPEKLAHYAKAALDFEFQYPFGWGELEGVHHRGDFDLRQHQQHSGKKFEYYDDEADMALKAAGVEKAESKAASTYLPVCIETSVGLGRTFLAVLCAAYDEDVQQTKHEGKADDIRIVLRLHPRLAPITCAVLPLSKKLSGPDSRAYKLSRKLLDAGLAVEFDDAGSIGKRYRRHDEIGTPWCITYDFDSVDDNAVTIRDRDSLKQDRVGLDEVVALIQRKLNT